jgi:hypothetical protein
VLYAIPGVGASATGGTNYVWHGLLDGLSGTPQLLGPPAQGTSTVIDGTTARPTFFSYQNNRIYAFDAAQAAAGTSGSGGAGSLTAVWSAATGCPPAGCVDNLGPSPVPLLVGSDGTVYHFRTNGEVQAWDPNGDRSTPPTGGTYPGRMLWSFSAPSSPWTSNVGTHPAIFQASGHDVLYFCTSTANTITLLNVKAASMPAPADYTQTTVPCGNLSPVVVDTAGYALVVGGSTLTLMAPDGSIASQLTYPGTISFGYDGDLILGNDGIAYLAAPGSFGSELTAVQVTPSHTLIQLWQVPGVGNAGGDAYSFPLLVPGTTPGTAHLMFDYPASSTRDWTSYSLGTTVKPLPGAWSMMGGDSRHRNSLKTQ